MTDGSIGESHRYLPEGDDLRPVQASITQDLIHGLKIELDARQSAHVLKPVSSSIEALQEMLQEARPRLRKFSDWSSTTQLGISSKR